MTPRIHICNQQFNTGFCMSERFDNNANHKIIKAVFICKLCVHWWLIVWLVLKISSDRMNQLSVPFLHKVHTRLPQPHTNSPKDQKQKVSSKHRSVHPPRRNSHIYPHKRGFSPLTFYWPSTGAKRWATCMQFPPQPLFTLIHNSHSCGHKTSIPFSWLWLATFLATHLYTQTTSLP